MYFVYALASKSRNYIYIGLSSELEKRIHAHNSGYKRTTRPYLQFRLIRQEKHATRIEARQREKYLKSTAGKTWLRAQIKKV